MVARLDGLSTLRGWEADRFDGRPSFHFRPPLDFTSGCAVRRILLLLLAVALITSLGCGGARERGKNKDYDRPTTQK